MDLLGDFFICFFDDLDFYAEMDFYLSLSFFFKETLPKGSFFIPLSIFISSFRDVSA